MTNTEYCVIRNNQDGEPYIYQRVSSLPERVQLPDGYTRTSLDQLTIEEQIALGVLPLEIINKDFDPETHSSDEGIYTIGADKVTLTYTLTPLSPEAIAELEVAKLTAAKNKRYDEVIILRKSSSQQAISYADDNTDYLMHADDTTITNVTSKYQSLLLSAPGTTVTWYFDDGQKLDINSTNAAAMLLLITTKDQVLRDVADSHITAIAALESITDVIEYDITAGW